jgi:hypothetical protein
MHDNENESKKIDEQIAPVNNDKDQELSEEIVQGCFCKNRGILTATKLNKIKFDNSICWF